MTAKKQQQQYERFRIGARIEHIILLVSFTILAVTGLPQRYAQYELAQNMIVAMGGIETVRLIHRYAAFLLVLGSVYHLFTSTYRLYVRRERNRMTPDLKDAQDLVGYVKYNVGLQEEHPKMRKFNFGEKLEFWAVVWGTAVMAITGFMLWNPIATTNILPGTIIPAAKAAHSYEALLAVISIVIWHFYNVMIKHWNPSMWTGKLPRHQMEEEHALELERLESGETPWPEVPAPILRRRRIIFTVTSVIVGSIILVVLVWAFTFEETALITVVPTREVFVPLATAVP
ncbi:MAG TPA: cytochrome b/b6 domain-containing protein [Chloroflexota bacterium]|nr:cytochrome b/b6 domain-containing protein [Chloroflexota bacterium]HUM70030.1 cytochrome b/b6 domain-containing protein [Chloroflexota bacterium]